MPKICCVLALSLIWKRGSSLGSVESMTSTRPSSGVLLSSGPKLTRIWTPLPFSASSVVAARARTLRREDASAIARRAGVMARQGMPDVWGDVWNGRSWFIFFSFEFVNIVENSGGDADGQDGQLADGFVPGPPGNVDHDATVQLDDFVVEDH